MFEVEYQLNKQRFFWRSNLYKYSFYKAHKMSTSCCPDGSWPALTEGTERKLCGTVENLDSTGEDLLRDSQTVQIE